MPANPAHCAPVVLYSVPTAQAAAGQCDCNCDCACAPAALETRRAAHHAAPHYQRAHAAWVALPDGFQAAYSQQAALGVLNRPARELLACFAHPARLSDALAWAEQAWGPAAGHSAAAALDRLVQAGLLLPAGQLAGLPPEPPHSLSAWLHLTGRCNLRCDYCYLPPQDAGQSLDMTLETGRQAVQAVLRSAQQHGYQQVRLKYAGGEPLLRFDLLAELHSYAKKNAGSYTLDGVVLSNGLLLDERKLAAMQQLGLQLMISLDSFGPHDHRRTPLGQPSSSQARAAIRLAAGRVPLFVSLTLTNVNLPHAAETVAWLLDEQVHFSLNFYREQAAPGCPAAGLMLDAQAADTLLSLYRQILARHPQHSLLGCWLDRANLSAAHLRPCGACESYLVIDPQGRVAKCQMAMHTPVSHVGAADPLGDVRRAGAGLHNPPVTEKDGCQDCAYRFACRGGCPLMAHHHTGHYDQPSPYCHLYRQVFPRLIELEGRRLLEQHRPAPTTATIA